MKNQNFWSHIVRLFHSALILFMIIAPFCKNREYVILHAIIVPFLYFHWLTNNDTCALTELEKYLSNKKENEETFIGSIISPVYKINLKDKCTIVKITKITTLLLWCFSLEKL